MITKVVHGWRPAGLLAYLLGPGTAEVHQAPRVIASWDGLDAAWQPASTGPGGARPGARAVDHRIARTSRRRRTADPIS